MIKIMNINVNQVGRRWFLCTNKEIDVEVTRSNGTKFVVNKEDTEKAGYTVWNHIQIVNYGITGKGARKYRNEIISAIEKYFELIAEQPNESGVRS